MNRSLILPEFQVQLERDTCVFCLRCIKECGFGVFAWDAKKEGIRIHEERCVACQRCLFTCPTKAITVKPHPSTRINHHYFQREHLQNITKQAETGGILLTSMGTDLPYPVYFDHLFFDASQVTNPAIDPLREPMEVRTFLGESPVVKFHSREEGEVFLTEEERPFPAVPPVEMQVPILFAAMSFGSLSLQASTALAIAARRLGTFYNTGEGGLHESLKKYQENTIVQVASGRFGVDRDYLLAGSMMEIKIGQGAKPGIGGHLPGEKINQEIALTRMIPEGTDALSPAPHHDIYSIEDLKQLIFALKEATSYQRPVIVKIAAVHNVAAIASGIVRAGGDVIAIDGSRGGTGAAPRILRDHSGIPIELAIAAVDDRLHQEGIRQRVSLLAGGGFRSSADVAKAILLGADAIYIGSAALVAMGCRLCHHCFSGKCSWGIATQREDFMKRLDPEEGAQRLVNLVNGWSLEIQEVMGSMGINAIESLRGNRLRLRGLGLSSQELEILGVKQAGESM